MNIIAISNHIGAAGSSVVKDFIIAVDTTLGDGLDNYTLNFTGAGYDIKTSDGQTITGATAATTINFPGPGTYDIKIRGDVSTRTFANDLKLVDIKNWGVLDTPLDDKFDGANSLTTITAPDQPVISSMTRLFKGAQNFAGGISHWDVSNIVSFQRAFYSTSFNEDISSWDTSSANTFSGMFNYTPFNNGGQPGIGNWDVSNVADFSGCFAVTPFNQPIGSWNIKTSGPVNMGGMFSQATSFNQDLNAWDVSGVTIMTRMFNYASSFNGDVSNWDVSGVADLGYMFERASSFNHPGIGSWNTSGATHMAGMFDGINTGMAFNQDISGWDVSNVLAMNSMFRNCYSLNQPFNSWNTSSLTSIPQVFFNCYSFNQPLNLWNTSNVTNMQNVFYGATAFNQDISSWDITKVTIFNSFFTTTAFSTDNYDAVLVSWEDQLQVAYPAGAGYIPTIAINFGAAKYTLGGTAEAARTSLINTYGWTITDGGGIAAPAVPFTTNLVASYNFDADFTDYTGNNPLTPSGSTPPVAGVSGGVVNNCAEFNSTGDYTLAADSDDFSFTDGVSDLPFSVSFWANFTSYNSGITSGAWFFSKRDASTNEEWQILNNQNAFTVTLFSGGGNSNLLNVSLSYPPPIGSWHHYAVTYDGSATFAGLKVYIDGVSQTLTNNSAGTYVGMVNTTQDLNIGSRSWAPSQGSFWGKMDETHVWKNRELTSAEVLDIYNTENAGSSIFPVDYTTDLVASYNFDSDFTDYTGVNNGTAAGTPLAAQSGGVVSNCLLNNSSSYVNMGNDSSLQANQYSVSAWFKCNLPGGSYRGIVVKQNTFGIFLQNYELGVYGWLGNGWIGTGQFLNDNNWHHVVFTFDDGVSNGAQLYLDGSPLGSPFTFAISNQSAPLVVGAGAAITTQSFNGNIDEVHVWTNRLLDATGVSNIYTTELAGNSIFIDFTTNLVASYNFDTDLTDYTGNNNGTTPGTITHSPFKVNNGADFSGGVNDYVALPNTSDDFTFHNGAGSDIPFSISFWIDDLDGSNNNDCYFWVGNDVNTRSVGIERSSINIIARCYTNTNNRLEYTYSIGSAVVPVHFCMTYDGSKTPSGLKFYVNGVDAAGTSTQVGTFTGINPISQMQTRVGTIANFSSYEYEGKMDELHIWKNRVLTAFEVSYLYYTENAGNSILP